MGDLAADRIYDEHVDDDAAYLATGTGVARVRVANCRVGRFDLLSRGTATDVAACTWGDELLIAAATPEEVLVHVPDGDEWTGTGFGPAEAVGFDHTDPDDPALIAVGADDHEVGRVLDPAADPTRWLTVADVDAPVRAVDGPFLAAEDGVYRLSPDGIDDAGLDDVRDVAVVEAAGELPAGSTGEPQADGDADDGGDDLPWRHGDVLAAAGDGLFRLDGAGGWTRVLEGSFDGVAVHGSIGIAAGEDGGHVRGPARTGDGWQAVDLAAAAVGVGAAAYAVTGDGTFLSRESEGWRRRTLGFPQVRAMSVVPGDGE
ncbi:MAG: hypothetical protein V5A23_09585 [Halobacteriales archaeon]